MFYNNCIICPHSATGKMGTWAPDLQFSIQYHSRIDFVDYIASYYM